MTGRASRQPVRLVRPLPRGGASRGVGRFAMRMPLVGTRMDPGPQATMSGRAEEASPRAPWRFGVRRVWRKGRRRAGLPWVATHRLIQRILKAGHAVAVALEAPELADNVKRRRLTYLFEPLSIDSTMQEKNQ